MNIAKLREKYGQHWGLDIAERKKKPPEPAPTIEQLQAFYARNPERVARLLGEQDLDQCSTEAPDQRSSHRTGENAG